MTTNAVADSAAWPAPAKLNLMLRVVGRRDDGYHLLQTVFQFIDLSDELTFRLRQPGEIRLRTPQPGIPAEQDLVVRAARLLQRRAGVAQGVDIGLRKRIPLGGGLGGGSSDAATVLVALNHLWGLNWPRQRLAELGLELGADVPIFIHAHTAWAEGVGERLQSLDLDEPWYLLIVPQCQVSTAAVFASAQLTRDAAPIRIADFLSGQIDNSCEPLVRREYPAVDQAMHWLGRYGRARLTGTGATVFLACSAKMQAQQIQQAANMHGFQAFIAHGMNTSPLLGRLEVEA